MTNEDIIAGCLKFNREARKVLYDKYASQMYSVCLRYANSKDDANDIFQQAFYTVYKNLHQIKNPAALSGWVKKIFVNTALEHLRKQAKFDNVDDIETVMETETNWNDAIQNISTQELTNLVQQLPEGSRMVFNLYAIEGYSHKEIAEQLGISEGTSKSQLFDARKFLKKAVIKLQTINTGVKKVV